MAAPAKATKTCIKALAPIKGPKVRKKPKADPKPTTTAAQGPRNIDRNIGTWEPSVAVKGGTITLNTTINGINIANAVKSAVIVSLFVSIELILFIVKPPSIIYLNHNRCIYTCQGILLVLTLVEFL